MTGSAIFHPIGELLPIGFKDQLSKAIRGIGYLQGPLGKRKHFGATK